MTGHKGTGRVIACDLLTSKREERWGEQRDEVKRRRSGGEGGG